MCSFNQSSPYSLEKEGKVSIDIEKKHQYHTVVYVTCNTCGKSYTAEDHRGYHHNYWSYFEIPKSSKI